jgi:hypothetical protein
MGAATTVKRVTIQTSGLLDLAGYDFTVTDVAGFANDGTLRMAGTQSISLTNDIDSGIWSYYGTSTLKSSGDRLFQSNRRKRRVGHRSASGIAAAGAVAIGSGAAAAVTNTGALSAAGTTVIDIGASSSSP